MVIEFTAGYTLGVTLSCKMGRHTESESCPENFFRSCEYAKFLVEYKTDEAKKLFRLGYKTAWREVNE